MRYAVEQRMRLIDFLLLHYGHFGRAELIDFFAISEPCASRDISLYNQEYPGNAVYDPSRRRWVRAETFQSRFS